MNSRRLCGTISQALCNGVCFRGCQVCPSCGWITDNGSDDPLGINHDRLNLILTNKDGRPLEEAGLDNLTRPRTSEPDQAKSRLPHGPALVLITWRFSCEMWLECQPCLRVLGSCGELLELSSESGSLSFFLSFLFFFLLFKGACIPLVDTQLALWLT